MFDVWCLRLWEGIVREMLSEGYSSLNKPFFTMTCECGLQITGNSENGLYALWGIHLERGVFHQRWKER